MLPAILFDVDGTLVDTNDLHAGAWQEAFRHFGFDLPFDRVRSQIGKGGDNLIPSLLPEDQVAAKQEEIETYRSDLFKRMYLPRAVPFPGVRDLFERLASEGCKVVLASSAKQEEVDYHLNLIGAREFVHETTSATEVEHSKPDPDIFAAALEKVAPLGADDVAVVGDSPFDIEAARKLGIFAIGFLSGGFPEEALREAGAAEIYDGPRDLLARLESSRISR